jgi:hypothetical protein
MAVVDDFNRPDGPLGSNWGYDTPNAAYAISGAQCVRGGAGSDYAAYTQVLLSDMYVAADIDLSGGQAGGYAALNLRSTGTRGQNLYLGLLRSDVVTLAKVVGGVYSEIVTVAHNVSGPTFHLRFDAVGSLLSLTVNGVLKAQATDTSIPTGAAQCGLSGSSGVKFDNFGYALFLTVSAANSTHLHVAGSPLLPALVTPDPTSHAVVDAGAPLLLPAALPISYGTHHVTSTDVVLGSPGVLFVDDAKHLHVADAAALLLPAALPMSPAKHLHVAGSPILQGINAPVQPIAATHKHVSGRPTLTTNTPVPGAPVRVHGIVCSYLGDGEYDIGKTGAWLNNFVNTLFFYDLNYGEAARKYMVDYAKTFPDAEFAYHPATSKGFYEDAPLFRQMAFQAADAAWEFQPDDWVVFIDASESLAMTSPFEQLLPDDEWPNLLTTLLEEARSANFPALTLPFFVFLQQGAVTENFMSADAALGNQLATTIAGLQAAIPIETNPATKAQMQVDLANALELQEINDSILYWTCDPHYMSGPRKLSRMFRVSYLRTQPAGTAAWQGIDTFTQATGSPARWANVAAYGYARYGEGPPPWTEETDGGFANRKLVQRVRNVGLPEVYATADVVGLPHPTGTQSPAYCYLYGNFDTGDGDPAFNKYVALWRQNPRDGVWYINHDLGPVPLDPLTGNPSVDPDLWVSQSTSTTGPVGTGRP